MNRKKKPRIKKRRTLRKKPLIILFSVIAAIVVLIMVIFPPVEYDSRRAQMEFSLTQNAVVIRDENAYYAEFDFTNIAFTADEGKKVSAGEELACVYNLGYTEDIAQRLYDVQEKVYNLQTKLMSGISNPEISDAEERVQLYRSELLQAKKTEGSRSILDIEHDLRSAVKARNALLREVVQPTEELQALYDEEATRSRQYNEWNSGRVVSQEDGIFSCYSDGMEVSLCMDKLDRISSVQIENALKSRGYTTARSSSNFMYRIVKPGKFCIGIITKKESVPRIYSGEEYTVKFNGLDMQLTGKCIKSEPSGDYFLSCIELEGDIGELLTRRTVNVTVTGLFSGNEVLIKAIHYNDAGETYVSFITPDGVKKINVDALATDKKYAIIRTTDSQDNIDGLKYSSRKD